MRIWTHFQKRSKICFLERIRRDFTPFGENGRERFREPESIHTICCFWRWQNQSSKGWMNMRTLLHWRFHALRSLSSCPATVRRLSSENPQSTLIYSAPMHRTAMKVQWQLHIKRTGLLHSAMYVRQSCLLSRNLYVFLVELDSGHLWKNSFLFMFL